MRLSFDVFTDCFLDGFGMIPGVFWETFRYQNNAKKEKGRFVEMLVLRT